MRPRTLRETYERILAGEPGEKAIGEFLDTYYGLGSADEHGRALADEPPLVGDRRLDAFAAAAASYLAKKCRAGSTSHGSPPPRRIPP